MKRNVFTMIGVVMVITVSGLGTITSYAAGPGETTTQTVAKPATYNQQSIRALGNWEQQGSIWKFKCLDGNYLTNAWLESLTEPGAFYYVDSNGNMMVNATTPDGYQVDGNGLWRSGVKQSTEIGSSVGSREDSSSSSTRDSSDDELSPEVLKFIKDNAGASAYGGLH